MLQRVGMVKLLLMMLINVSGTSVAFLLSECRWIDISCLTYLGQPCNVPFRVNWD